MKRESDFITFPGTGLWILVESGPNDPIIRIYDKFPNDVLSLYVNNPRWKIFCVDKGIGAHNLMWVTHGEKSASATLVTPRILKQYLKE
jgi:hypothetical protein